MGLYFQIQSQRMHRSNCRMRHSILKHIVRSEKKDQTGCCPIEDRLMSLVPPPYVLGRFPGQSRGYG